MGLSIVAAGLPQALPLGGPSSPHSWSHSYLCHSLPPCTQEAALCSSLGSRRASCVTGLKEPFLREEDLLQGSGVRWVDLRI